jgi:ribosomal protein L11 methyltransferase
MKRRTAFRSPARNLTWQLAVLTSREAEDAVSELLTSLFHQSAAVYFDCESNLSTCTIYSTTRPIRRSTDSVRTGLRTIQMCGLNSRPGKISVKRLPYKSWAESWKRHFKPIHLAGKVLIKPSWRRLAPRQGESVIVLDPGLSFGTGHHPTTGFCLRELARARDSKQIQSFLDLGTGSGILAITAAKLGYHPIQALDIDPEAVRVAKANAAANRVSEMLRITRVDLGRLGVASRRTYSVICANLMADLIFSNRKIILARLAPGGRLIVAGILRKEFDLVHQAFDAEGLRLIASHAEKEWRSGTLASR